ncbi:MAG: metallophosphoesterase family protein [Chloroflexota bacterium]|nr:metallophosphoesterase family protein [Chloroflexota bacterium]
MRYAIFTDIHANLEALEAVLKKIDEIAREKPIDQIWFLGDLVGYGPNPNECITTLRERTDVIIAGNHDWAAVGKIDLEDFSAAARVSAEWTAEQLTEEHRTFLANLPERLEIHECTLVHGSPYGPLWEYLTSEVLAERSFQYFSSRFCFVGHTHVPVIFQQPDSIANAPTLPLVDVTKNGLSHYEANEEEPSSEAHNEDKVEMAMIQPMLSSSKTAAQAESAYADPETGHSLTEEDANTVIEGSKEGSDGQDEQDSKDVENSPTIEKEIDAPQDASDEVDQTQAHAVDDVGKTGEAASKEVEDEGTPHDVPSVDETKGLSIEDTDDLEEHGAAEVEGAAGGEEESEGVVKSDEVTPEEVILSVEDRLNSEIEELLSLLGLSESMIQVSNEMIIPPEGHWEALAGFRAIINPGGVGQPRDGDPRAAFMIYDTEAGYEFYRVPYAFEQTQEKIVKVGLPQYLAIRLAVGR